MPFLLRATKWKQVKLLPCRAMILSFSLLSLVGCAKNANEPAGIAGEGAGKVIHIASGPNVQEETQTALIKARSGDTIEFEAGTHEFTMGLSLAVEGVTIRGQGMDKTFLSFKKQDAGKEGLLVTRGRFVIEDLTISDTKGDALKVNDADGVIFRRVRAQWTGGSKETNGAYGLYPVQCKNVLIEDCVAIAASDAGIYVGQSQNVIVRRCRAERNVAGIEIENCIDADVHENTATDNAGGLLVFDLPGLQVKNGRRIRVFNNRVHHNNHENFAPKGNMVASVAPGTGMIVMATDQVEVFNNQIADNHTYGLAVMSFLITGRPIGDNDYDPFPEGIYVHGNTFAGSNGVHPGGERGKFLVSLLGQPLPDIVCDGATNPAKLVKGKAPAELRVYFKNNRATTAFTIRSYERPITFANLRLDASDPTRFGKNEPERDLKPFEGELPPLPPVRLPGDR